MRNARILACALLFVFVGASAQASSNAPLTREALAAILGLSPVAGSCAAQQDREPPRERPRVQTKALCTATAHCETGTVSCSSNVNAANCSAVDRDCANCEQGHVTCDGATTWCPTTCGGYYQHRCCACAQTGDCMSCCVCAGGSIDQCSLECNGVI